MVAWKGGVEVAQRVVRSVAYWAVKMVGQLAVEKEHELAVGLVGKWAGQTVDDWVVLSVYLMELK